MKPAQKLTHPAVAVAVFEAEVAAVSNNED